MQHVACREGGQHLGRKARVALGGHQARKELAHVAAVLAHRVQQHRELLGREARQEGVLLAQRSKVGRGLQGLGGVLPQRKGPASAQTLGNIRSPA